MNEKRKYFSDVFLSLLHLSLCDDISDVKWRKAKHMVLRVLYHSYYERRHCFAWKHVNSARNFILKFFSHSTFSPQNSQIKKISSSSFFTTRRVTQHRKFVTEFIHNTPATIYSNYEFKTAEKKVENNNVMMRMIRPRWVWMEVELGKRDTHMRRRHQCVLEKKKSKMKQTWRYMENINKQ